MILPGLLQKLSQPALLAPRALMLCTPHEARIPVAPVKSKSANRDYSKRADLVEKGGEAVFRCHKVKILPFVVLCLFGYVSSARTPASGRSAVQLQGAVHSFGGPTCRTCQGSTGCAVRARCPPQSSQLSTPHLSMIPRSSAMPYLYSCHAIFWNVMMVVKK